MTEIIIQKQKEKTIIALIESGKLIEYYEDTQRKIEKKELYI